MDQPWWEQLLRSLSGRVPQGIQAGEATKARNAFNPSKVGYSPNTAGNADVFGGTPGSQAGFANTENMSVPTTVPEMSTGAPRAPVGAAATGANGSLGKTLGTVGGGVNTALDIYDILKGPSAGEGITNQVRQETGATGALPEAPTSMSKGVKAGEKAAEFGLSFVPGGGFAAMGMNVLGNAKEKSDQEKWMKELLGSAYGQTTLGDMGVKPVMPSADPALSVQNVDQVAGVNNPMSGAMTGAGIGTTIMPGIGTAIGAGAGALKGWADQLREKGNVAADIIDPIGSLIGGGKSKADKEKEMKKQQQKNEDNMQMAQNRQNAVARSRESAAGGEPAPQAPGGSPDTGGNPFANADPQQLMQLLQFFQGQRQGAAPAGPARRV